MTQNWENYLEFSRERERERELDRNNRGGKMDKSLRDTDDRLRRENGDGEMPRIFQTYFKKPAHTIHQLLVQRTMCSVAHW